MATTCGKCGWQLGVDFDDTPWIDAARSVDALRMPPGNRLEALKGDRVGTYSVRVNDQYRIAFRFEGGNAYEVGCEDYH